MQFRKKSLESALSVMLLNSLKDSKSVRETVLFLQVKSPLQNRYKK
jgi:hypothetical protein